MTSSDRNTGIKSNEVSDADQQWWESRTPHSDRAIRHLVSDFDHISDHAIPYAHLPSRAQSIYKPTFLRWSDLADETLSSLIGRPGGGASTVRAILIAARDAVAASYAAPSATGHDATSAAMRLLAALSLSDRALLAARIWRRPAVSKIETALQLGVTPSWVARHQLSARARFDELCADPVHSAAIEYAGRLRRRLGPVVREHNLTAALHELGIDTTGEIADLFVYLAGPYASRGTWWERAATNGLAKAAGQVDVAFAISPVPTNAALLRALADIGIPADVGVEYLDTVEGKRRFGDRWVQWGKTLTDRAESILHLRLKHAPASAETIAALIGEPDRAAALRQALSEDSRFVRVSQHQWALRQWGVKEYLGIFTEMTSRIDAAGGAIALTDLVDAMMSAFPDIAESSIKTYATKSAALVTEHGMLRRRNDSDGEVVAAPLRTARGAFSNGRNQVRVAFDVNGELLRGSGQHVHHAVASALGIAPGGERRFTSATDTVVKWRLSSATGPSVGSLRTFAADVDAVAGDTLVMVFDLDTGSVGAARIRAGEPDETRLTALLGSATHGNAPAALARALDCRVDEVEAILRRRGDNQLADLVASNEGRQ